MSETSSVGGSDSTKSASRSTFYIETPEGEGGGEMSAAMFGQNAALLSSGKGAICDRDSSRNESRISGRNSPHPPPANLSKSREPRYV